MTKRNRAALILSMLIAALLNLALTACWPIKPNPTVVLPESKVQKLSKGESASFDGFLLTAGALAKLLETAEKCQKP